MMSIWLIARPTAVPSRPPVRLSRLDSSRNWRRIVRRGAPERLADADLAGPLGDRDQHDVGDAESADQQADAGDDAEQHGERPAGRLLRLQQRRGALQRERQVGGRRADVAESAEHGLDLGLRRVDAVGVGGLDDDRVQRAGAGQLGADGRDGRDCRRHERRRARALGLEDADDLEGRRAELDVLSDGRVGGAEQVLGRRGGRVRPRARPGTRRPM